MNAPQPFPYQGSKRKLARRILRFVPADTRAVIEPFAGSAAVSLAVANAMPHASFLINDLNAPLIQLWRAILDDPEGLASAYRKLWEAQEGRQREFYDEVRRDFNREPRPDRLLYLLARCVKASVRYNSQGEFNQSPDNRRAGMRPATMRQNILRTSMCLNRRATLSCTDYWAVLGTAEPGDVVYMDPPYQGVSEGRDQRYLAGVPFEEFVVALEFLNRNEVSYIISYDGRTGTKEHGKALPMSLDLDVIELDAGWSTQATLLGGTAKTYESLYISRSLANRLRTADIAIVRRDQLEGAQLFLFGE